MQINLLCTSCFHIELPPINITTFLCMKSYKLRWTYSVNITKIRANVISQSQAQLCKFISNIVFLQPTVCGPLPIAYSYVYREHHKSVACVTLLYLSISFQYGYPFYKTLDFFKHWQFRTILSINKTTIDMFYWSFHRNKVSGSSLNTECITIFNTSARSFNLNSILELLLASVSSLALS